MELMLVEAQEQEGKGMVPQETGVNIYLLFGRKKMIIQDILYLKKIYLILLPGNLVIGSHLI